MTLALAVLLNMAASVLIEKRKKTNKYSANESESVFVMFQGGEIHHKTFIWTFESAFFSGFNRFGPHGGARGQKRNGGFIHSLQSD